MLTADPAIVQLANGISTAAREERLVYEKRLGLPKSEETDELDRRGVELVVELEEARTELVKLGRQRWGAV